MKYLVKIIIGLCLMANVSIANVILYQPNVVGNPEPTRLGHGVDGQPMQDMQAIQWVAYYGADATQTPPTNANWDTGFAQTHTTLATRAGGSNPYRANPPAFLWTENFQNTADVSEISEIFFVTANSVPSGENPGPIGRLALRVNSEWYVSHTTYSEYGVQPYTLSAATLATMDFLGLDFTPGTVLERGVLPVSFGDLSGEVDAVGFFYDSVGTDRVRLTDMSVTAIPEPSTYALILGAKL